MQQACGYGYPISAIYDLVVRWVLEEYGNRLGLRVATTVIQRRLFVPKILVLVQGQESKVKVEIFVQTQKPGINRIRYLLLIITTHDFAVSLWVQCHRYLNSRLPMHAFFWLRSVCFSTKNLNMLFFALCAVCDVWGLFFRRPREPAWNLRLRHPVA